MNWMFYAAVAAVSLAAADVFLKMAAGKVPNSLGTLIYGTVAFGVGLTWFVIDRARGVVERSSTAGIAYAVGVAGTPAPVRPRVAAGAGSSSTPTRLAAVCRARCGTCE